MSTTATTNTPDNILPGWSDADCNRCDRDHAQPNNGPLEPNRSQIEIFVDAIFRHATEGFVSIRAFHEEDASKPFRITPTKLTSGLPFLIEVAEDDARRAAQFPKPVVFCPPLATFIGRDRAREADIAEGLALSVECDEHPQKARATLEALLGPATCVVRSGGRWLNGGEPEDKLHLHWRLATPARGNKLTELKKARDLAARIVGGDPSNKAVCHPIRWPGSWHRKTEPRLCEIETINADTEIDLNRALAALSAAAPQPRASPYNDGANSGEQADWPTLVTDIVSGRSYHAPLVSIAARMVGSGAGDQIVTKLLRGLMEASSGPRDGRWQARHDAIPRIVDSAAEKFGPINGEQVETTAGAPPLAWLDLSAWDDQPTPQRKWAIRDRVPLNQAGLFSGEGGTGKSIIELMKDVAHVAGKDWLGSLPEPGPAFYIGAEDDADELHIRLDAIADHYKVTFKNLVKDGLHVLCLLGQDATLCAPMGKSGKVETTALYKWLYEAAGDIKPKNISVDTLSRAFAGNEIDRVQVYAFAMHMQALAMVAEGAVTVLSHPSLQGLNSGSGFSGSTAWHGAFRFRQYLKGVRPEDGEQPDNNLRQLEFKKNQYGPLPETVILRYRNGLFLPETGISRLEKLAGDAKVEELFLKLLGRFNNQERNVSDKRGTSYAPAIFAEEVEARAAKVGKHALADAMARLFATNRIHLEQYGYACRNTFKLVSGAKP
jgi:RecA-family ATPase